MWTVDVPWLEPDEVTAYLRTGAEWVIEWCWGRGRPQLCWADDSDPDALDEVLPELVTAEQVMRQRRKSRTVFVAALLRPQNGFGRLVLLSEGPAVARF